MSEQNELVVYSGGDLEQQRFMPVMALSTALDRRQIIVDATKKLMQDGVDFGTIPGAGDRPTLKQPGADKLCNLFGLVIKYEILEQVKDWTGADHGGEPFFYVEVKGRAFRGEVCMGEGIGSCSSWESKYRYRQGDRKCPQCGKAAIIKGREEYGGGWLCFAKKGGCGAKFLDGDQSIESQDVGRKANPDVFDQLNTVQKMAFKRAKVSTTINATSASEFFTQDVEDQPAEEPPPAPQPKRQSTWAEGKKAQKEVLERKMQDLSDRPKPVSSLSPVRNATPPVVTDEDLPTILHGTYQPEENPAHQYRARTIEMLQGGDHNSSDPARPWSNRREMKEAFNQLRLKLATFDDDQTCPFAASIYAAELKKSNVESPDQFRSSAEALACFERLQKRIATCELTTNSAALTETAVLEVAE